MKSTTAKVLKRSFVVVSQTRNLEIECAQDGQAENICYELEEAVRNSHRMHLSYRF